MGTQFSSRLSDRDKQQILSTIRSLRLPAGSRRRGAGGTRALKDLTPAERRELGRATVGQILAVAERHGFSEKFRSSDRFTKALEWLKGLRSDAAFSQFRTIIEQYQLAGLASPSAELTRQLRALLSSTDEAEDPFRVAVSNAARAVLSEAATRPAKRESDDTEASFFGKRLASMPLRDLVARFSGAFVSEFLESLVHRADYQKADAFSSDAVELAREQAERIARRAVKRIEEEARLADTQRAHDIVFEELMQLLHASSAPAPVP
jgi:hypothetical protein